MEINKNRILNYVFWFWFIMVIILSILPATPKSRINLWGLDFRMDYVEHLVVYFMLGLLYVNRKKSLVNETIPIKVLYILIWMIFAIVTELVQKFVAGRSFNPNDMFYNVIGIILGLVITMTYFNKLNKRMIHENLVSK